MVVKSDNKNKQYYIPIETTLEFARAHGYSNEDFKWTKIGSRTKRMLLIPCTEEEYREYMRPIWADMKREERKQKYLTKNGIELVSVERIRDDFELELVDTTTIKEEISKSELISDILEQIDKLDEKDKQIIKLFIEEKSEAAIGKEIGMSQKGVNKRKNKIFKKLKLHFLN